MPGARQTTRAKATRGATKYGEGNSHRLYTKNIDISDRHRQQLAELTSLSLTKKTWANYKTAEVMLARCCKENKIKKELPVSESTILTFVLWLVQNRGVKAATVNAYLARVRQLHLMKGVDPPRIRSNLVNGALKGLAHREQAARNASPSTRERQPVTPDILLLIKARLAESSLPPVDQRLLWTFCTVAFFGAFRGAELLCRAESQFNPAYTLLHEDVVLVADKESNGHTLQFKIKSPKEDKKGKAVIVDIFQSRADICPIAAWEKWQKLGPPCERGQPAFRWSSGAPLTSRRVNEILRERLTGYIDGGERFYTTHSFRTGAASMLGMLGFSTEDIKSMGKWTSNSYERYLKLPRSKRMTVAREFSNQFMM